MTLYKVQDYNVQTMVLDLEGFRVNAENPFFFFFN